MLGPKIKTFPWCSWGRLDADSALSSLRWTSHRQKNAELCLSGQREALESSRSGPGWSSAFLPGCWGQAVSRGGCQLSPGGSGSCRGEAQLGCLSAAAWIFHGREPSRSNFELWQIAFCIRAQGFAAKPHPARGLSGQRRQGGASGLVFSTVKLWMHPLSSHLSGVFRGCVTFWNGRSVRLGGSTFRGLVWASFLPSDKGMVSIEIIVMIIATNTITTTIDVY